MWFFGTETLHLHLSIRSDGSKRRWWNSGNEINAAWAEAPDEVWARFLISVASLHNGVAT